jgi:hypothetical protein
MFQPKCVATTVKSRDGPNVDEKRLPGIHAESFYRSLQWCGQDDIVHDIISLTYAGPQMERA